MNERIVMTTQTYSNDSILMTSQRHEDHEERCGFGEERHEQRREARRCRPDGAVQQGHICIYIYIYTLHIYIYIYLHMYMSTHTCMHAHMICI